MSTPADAAGTLTVVVAIDRGPRNVEERTLQLPAGACLGDAIRAAGLPADTDAGIWGRAMPAATLLAAGDRAETYRPLRVDPKTARRERFRKQGARGTGLFARKD